MIRGQFVFTMHTLAENILSLISVWYTYKGSEIVCSVHIWANNPTNHAQAPKKDQVYCKTLSDPVVFILFILGTHLQG